MKRHSITVTARCAYVGKNGRCTRDTSITHPYCGKHTREVLGVRVAKSTVPMAGRGLFAERDFKKGEYIAQYGGEILTTEQYDKRYADDAMGAYGVQLDADRVIDARKTSAGVARYACDYHGSKRKPNAEYVADDEKDEVWVVATRAIKKGDEILTDYGDDMHRAMGLGV
ncbi:MAG: SET domain-containing protein [Bradyrhizobiaceae bacterium]|nr:SET domain-containing protein [Bradyrhizobiaceae bacterium]